MRSSDESSASSRGSRATNLATNSSARNATAPGQCSDAVNRRFANAAARQGGTVTRGANARYSARKSRSLEDSTSTSTADADANVVIELAVSNAVVVAMLLPIAAVVPRAHGVASAGLLPLQGPTSAASISGARLSDWTRAYSWFVKSLKSMVSASPVKRKRRIKKGSERWMDQIRRAGPLGV